MARVNLEERAASLVVPPPVELGRICDCDGLDRVDKARCGVLEHASFAGGSEATQSSRVGKAGHTG
eukprot:1176146-Prorocentrum_minimum.AAC.2